MSAVVRLIPNNALAVNQQELAARLHELADRISAEEIGAVERVCVVLDIADGVYYRVYGRQCNRAELVGLLEYTKARIMNGDD